MIVHTYHDPSVDPSGSQKALLELWAKSWQARGWETAVLGPGDARKHIYFDIISKSDFLRLTVNDWNYSFACYCKWMAMVQVGGMYADPDVINYGFTPPNWNEAEYRWIPRMMHGMIPSCMFGAKEFYHFVCRTIRNVSVMRQAGPRCIWDDLNDMNIFSDFWSGHVQAEHICYAYKEDSGWETALMVHYHNGVCHGNRVDEIQRVRPI